MADAAPTTPTEKQPTLKVPASKPLVVAVVLAFILGSAGLGLAAWHHFHPPAPAPAPPKPPPAPTPTPIPPLPAPDLAPKAVVSGTFWPGSPTPVQADGPDAPATLLGLVRLDATASTSARTIQWRVKGPGSPRIRTFSPDGQLGSSLGEVDLYQPGTYHFHGTAIGWDKGLPITDTSSVSFTVKAPGPPDKPDVPKPEPPRPDPPKPSPDTPPDPSLDPKFYQLGRTYSGTLASTYADALDAGASMLASGQTLSAAMAGIAKQWESGRSSAFEKSLTPEFARIIPESTKDADITSAQKDAMARACRSVAAGLRK